MNSPSKTDVVAVMNHSDSFTREEICGPADFWGCLKMSSALPSVYVIEGDTFTWFWTCFFLFQNWIL